MDPNIGVIDANVRRFIAVPSVVLAATSAIAYHAYLVTIVSLIIGAYFLFSGFVRVSPMYTALGVSSVGGLHRVARASR